jgi:hypothetical protein
MGVISSRNRPNETGLDGKLELIPREIELLLRVTWPDPCAQSVQNWRCRSRIKHIPGITELRRFLRDQTSLGQSLA